MFSNVIIKTENSTSVQNYNINEIQITNRKVNELSEYMKQFNSTYNLDKVAVLPSENIRVGNVKVVNNDTGVPDEYMFLLDKFSVELTYLYDDPSRQQKVAPKDYTFMLIMPREVIEKKIMDVNNDVTSDINAVFIIPFAAFSLVMMFVISYFLQKISIQITQPIIELFMKIQDIITAHQKEKEQLIKDQSRLN